MVSSPTAVHESVLVAMNRSLTWTLVTIPVPVQTLLCTVMANNYFEGDSIHTIPDLTIKLHRDQVGREIWLMESAFSQTNESVMKKLRGYVRDIPGLLVVGKILFQESAVSQSVDLGRSNNPNTTPTKDYENVRVVVYLRGVQRGCAEEGERGSTPTG